jgi:hypothetical protein
MKRRAFIAAPAILYGCSPAVVKLPASPKFLVAGQSNAVCPAQEHPHYWSQTGRVTVTDYYHGMVRRIPTRDNPMDGSIVWIYTGDMLERDVTFVNVARGAQNTHKWLHEHLEGRLKPAMAKEKFDAVLWVQGESDWLENFTEEQTYTNMRKLIIGSRKLQGNIPWFVAINSAHTEPPENRVRKAQKRIIAEGLALAGPDLDSIRENPAWVEKTRIEYVGEGIKEHGRRWAETLRPYF